jgi:hypothetical protein
MHLMESGNHFAVVSVLDRSVHQSERDQYRSNLFKKTIELHEGKPEIKVISMYQIVGLSSKLLE